jgi:integrase/recombinase XerD
MASAPKTSRYSTTSLGMPVEDSLTMFIESRASGISGARHQNAKSTQDAYRADLTGFVQYVAKLKGNVKFFNQLTAEHIIGYIKRIQSNENWADATKQKTLRSFRAYLNWVKKDQSCAQQGMNSDEFLKMLPRIGVTKPRLYIPSEDDMGTFIAGFNTKLIWGMRNYVVALVMLDCGARIGELCSVNEDCVMWDQANLYINKGKTGERKVSLTPGVLAQVKTWVRERSRIAQCNALFVGRQGFRMNPIGFAHEWDKNRKRTEVGDTPEGRLTPHTMRHYFCTQYLANGGTIPMLMQITGHTSMTTLQVYLHLAQRLTSVKAEHSRVSPVKTLLEGKRKRTFRS